MEEWAKYAYIQTCLRNGKETLPLQMKSTDEWMPLCFGDRKVCPLRSQESFSELLNDGENAAIVFSTSS